MGVREGLNSHRRLTIGLTVAVVAFAVGFAAWTIFAGDEKTAGQKIWFSDDDGKTWFKDDATKITPFDHNGKPAVMCFVYTYDGGKTLWAAYLMRHQAGWKEKVGAFTKHRPSNPRDMMAINAPPMEVKKPGANDWFLVTDPRGETITDPREIRAPNGSTANVEQVEP